MLLGYFQGGSWSVSFLEVLFCDGVVLRVKVIFYAGGVDCRCLAD